jgi:hypothetical protein
MARKRRDPYRDEVIRPERILFILSGVMTPCWIALSAVFFPALLLEGVLVGVICTFIFALGGFAVVMGRHWAPKAVFQNEVTEITRPSVWNLEPPPYTMPEGSEQFPVGFPGDTTRILDQKAANAQAGVDEFGRVVPWGALRMGGWRIGKKERWDIEGKDGILLLIGNDKFIRCGENLIFPGDKILMRHEEVWEGALRQLQHLTGGWFIPYDPAFKLYRLSEPGEPWVRHYRESPDVKAHFLDRLGLPGLAKELVLELKRKGVRIADPDSQVSFDTLAETFGGWMERRGVSINRDAFGASTTAAAWATVRHLQSENTRLTTENAIATGHGTELQAQIRDRDRRDAMMYSGGEASTAAPSQIASRFDQMQGGRVRQEGR